MERREHKTKGDDMRNKIVYLILLACFSLTTTFCYAQSRQASPVTANHANTNYSNVAAYGLDVDGNPGFMIMTGVANGVSEDWRPNYYLWIDETGDLCVASYPDLTAYASFPSGDMQFSDSYCNKVGSQS